MKRLAAAFASSALAVATLAMAQQTSSPTTAPQQTAPSPNSSTRLSDADKQAMMKDCLTKVTAANPGASQKDIQAYCDKRVKTYSAPQQ